MVIRKKRKVAKKPVVKKAVKRGPRKVQNGFLTPVQISRLIGVTPQWVSELIAKGELSSHRIGKRGWHHIPRVSFDEFVARNDLLVDWAVLDQGNSSNSN